VKIKYDTALGATAGVSSEHFSVQLKEVAVLGPYLRRGLGMFTVEVCGVICMELKAGQTSGLGVEKMFGSQHTSLSQHTNHSLIINIQYNSYCVFI